MNNLRSLQACGLASIFWAVAVCSVPQQSALAQSKPTNRTYQIFPGVTFPHFPGTGGTRPTTGPTTTPAKPVIPLVEVPTPGLKPVRSATNRTNSGQRTNQRQRNNTVRQAPAEQPRTRRSRRAKPQS
jgi:hypothetical protein